MSETNVEWRVIPGLERYEVSSAGHIRRADTGRLRKLSPDDSGYPCFMVRMNGKNRRVHLHHALLLAFVGPCPPGCEARHLDDNPDHFALDNLAWGTRAQNVADKRRNGGFPRGERSVSAKLTADQVREIRGRVGGETLRALAAEYGVSHTAIRRAAAGWTWGDLR